MPTRKLGSERYGLDSKEEGEGMVSARGKQSFSSPISLKSNV